MNPTDQSREYSDHNIFKMDPFHKDTPYDNRMLTDSGIISHKPAN